MQASGPARSGPAARRSDPVARLRRLSDAYDVPAALGAIADALISRTHLGGGAYERAAVMEILAFVAQDDNALTALETGGALPDAVLNHMSDLIAIDPPVTVPEWELLQAVLESLGRALGASGPRDAPNGELAPDARAAPGR